MEVLCIVTPVLPVCLMVTDSFTSVNVASISFSVVETTDLLFELITIL